ncbi:MAG: GTP pyrophosphokinase family protein [Clostridia bacterium]|nr:GTP pyrophosphokinase family protein [Clostridia bacterium]MBQ2433399.1 GTP pyrophosphokinase family protein [Clostridia bacterium]MBQ5771049.1 GTP pyrophosphokinase family protein [Clostridia bacterium]
MINNTAEEGMLQRKRLEAFFDEELITWSKEIMQEYKRLMAYYRCAIMEIETKFNVLNEEFSLRYDRNPISGIRTRLKSLDSIKEKLERKGLPFKWTTMQERILDVAGVRVICSFADDVYLLADALLKQDDITLLEKKDYIAAPKQSGYRSLHLIVAVPIYLEHEKRVMPVEIQLRTIQMDFWASLEHQLRYKKNFDFTDQMAKELQDCADLSAQLDARMDSLRKMVEINRE